MAMARRLKLIVAYDGTEFAGWQSQSHGNTIQDHRERAFTGPAERTPAYTLSRNAHTSMLVSLCHLTAGSKHSMRCCLLPFACFVVDMPRTISTRVCRQKERSIAT